MIRALVEATAGAAIILALAYVFLMSSVPHANAANLCPGVKWVASWYGTESGSRTANGEFFDGRSFTAAHKTLPFGTKLRVWYKGRNVTVRVNDRGPYIAGRSLDLSYAAARHIGLTLPGVATVCVERLD